MKASELVQLLNELISENGDNELKLYDDATDYYYDIINVNQEECMDVDDETGDEITANVFAIKYNLNS